MRDSDRSPPSSRRISSISCARPPTACRSRSPAPWKSHGLDAAAELPPPPSPKRSPTSNIPRAAPASRTGRVTQRRARQPGGDLTHGMQIGDGDRGFSWLPFYHDMGLVGCMLRASPTRCRPTISRRGIRAAAAPVADADHPQPGHRRSARRSATTSAPGACAPATPNRSTCRAWRVAGNGADMIRPDVDASASSTCSRRPASRRAPSCRATASPNDAGGQLRPLGRGACGEWSTWKPCRQGRGPRRGRARRRSATASSTAAGRCAAWRSRSATRAAGLCRSASARSAARPDGDVGLFPRRGGTRAVLSPTAGSTPATWAICRRLLCTSSAAPRT